jgi:hypothetical protein
VGEVGKLGLPRRVEGVWEKGEPLSFGKVCTGDEVICFFEWLRGIFVGDIGDDRTFNIENCEKVWREISGCYRRSPDV